MNPWLLIVLVPLAAAGAAWLLESAAHRRAEKRAEVLRRDMQAQLAAQSQAFSAQMSQLAQSVSAQLNQVAQQVQSGMASAVNVSTSTQKAVSEQLQASTKMLGTIREQLGGVQQSGRDLFEAARQIESVLGAAKMRGTLGEVALERMLADALPAAMFELQYRFSTGEAVDAVIRLRDKLLPVDSKFPLEQYRRLMETGEEARPKFSTAVRSHADSIAKKYILPGEGTLDIAFMFVPSEGVYYELLRSEDTKGAALDEYCRCEGIVPVSPSTLFAHLKVIFLAFRGMQVAEDATRLLASVNGLSKQMDNFAEVYEKMGTHLRNAQQSYADAEQKLDRARDGLNALAQGTPAAKELEPA